MGRRNFAQSLQYEGDLHGQLQEFLVRDAERLQEDDHIVSWCMPACVMQTHQMLCHFLPGASAVELGLQLLQAVVGSDLLDVLRLDQNIFLLWNRNERSIR